MLGRKLSLFLYYILTRLSVQTGILSFSKHPVFLFSFQFTSPLTDFLSSVPLYFVPHGLMRSLLHNTVITPTHHSLDIKAAQLFQPLCLVSDTHTNPEDVLEITGPSQNSALWGCSHPLLPSPSGTELE